MNKEKNNATKPLIQSRGRWSIRLNNELLDLAQREVDSWEFISKKLGFSVEECKQQYDFLLHPEKYEQQFMNTPNTKKGAKENRPKDEGKEKKRHRTVVKPAPCVVREPHHPSCYSTWESERKKMWDQIPFNANEYYMRYLPPGIERRPADWSDAEIEELLSLVQIYPPNEKWGLFSLHMLGRTGYECECQFKKLTSKKEESTTQPEVHEAELSPVKEDTHLIEKEHHCFIKNNIVLSESESCLSSPLSVPRESTHLPAELDCLPDLIVPPVSPVISECNESSSPKEMIAEPVSLPGLTLPPVSPVIDEENEIVSPVINEENEIVSPVINEENEIVSPITNQNNEGVSLKKMIAEPMAEISVSTPPRTSVKRSVVCNDSPMVTPSKMCSVSQPVFITPVKNLGQETKSIGVSPTKVVFEEEESALPVFENKSIVLTAKMRRLMKEQEEERNRFRSLMKKQITAMQDTFNLGLVRWNGKEFAEIQKQYQKQYNQLCRTLQLQYNTLIAKQVHHMQYYGIPAHKEKLYSLNFPKISFSMKLF